MSEQLRFQENNHNQKEPPQKAAMYVRMSTEHQKYSTENQEIQIRKYADENNIEIVSSYHDDGQSGLTIKNRNGMQRLLSDIESGNTPFNMLLVLDTTRWGRYQNLDESAHYNYLCTSNGIEVIYVAEPHLNGNQATAYVMRTIHRMEAAHYSARLSDKVKQGQETLIKKGYRQGGPPGFGLRRLMIDEHGNKKTVLKRGEHKSLQTDRIILISGPDEEIEIVNWMYRMFVDEYWSETQIAEDLNRRGIQTDFKRPWTRQTVHQILTNEKYIGSNVFNRQSFKLKEKRVKNPREKWVIKENAFEPIVDISYFYKAQGIIHERSKRYSDEEMLDKLQALRKKKGWLSAILIDETEDMPSSGAYQSRFNGLTRAYKLIDYDPGRDMSYIEINKTLRALYPEVCENVIQQIEEFGGSVSRQIKQKTDLIVINDEVSVSIIISRCRQTKAGSNRWEAHFDNENRPDITIIVRMDASNEEPLDYYIIPAIDIENPKLRLSDNNSLALDCYRFDHLEPFLRLTEREKIREAA